MYLENNGGYGPHFAEWSSNVVGLAMPADKYDGEKLNFATVHDLTLRMKTAQIVQHLHNDLVIENGGVRGDLALTNSHGQHELDLVNNKFQLLAEKLHIVKKVPRLLGVARSA